MTKKLTIWSDYFDSATGVYTPPKVEITKSNKDKYPDDIIGDYFFARNMRRNGKNVKFICVESLLSFSDPIDEKQKTFGTFKYMTEDSFNKKLSQIR